MSVSLIEFGFQVDNNINNTIKVKIDENYVLYVDEVAARYLEA